MKSPILKISALLLLVFLVLICIPDLVYSQPALPAKPTQNPIDGGLVILAAAGGGYAIKKLRDRKK